MEHISVYTRTMKKNTESFLVASKETGLKVNSNKTKYMVVFRDQNAGRSHSITTDICFFGRVEGGKYLVTILTNQNYILQEIRSRFKSWNACYHSVKNLLSSSLL